MPILRMFSLAAPKLNRKATVSKSTENAQGFTLSSKAETLTSGKSHVPSLEKDHSKAVPASPNRKKRNTASKNSAAAAKPINLFMH